MSAQPLHAPSSAPTPVRTFCAPSATRTLLAAFALLGGVFVAGPTASAQEVTTTPVGAVSVTIKGNNSDTIVSIPLNNGAAIAQSSVATISQSSPNIYSIELTSGSFASNSLSGTHYVRIKSGAKAGMYYTILDNTGSSLSIDAAGDDLSAIQPADNISIQKHWTLDTLFPSSAGNTSANPLTPSLGTLSFQRRSQILLPNLTGNGTNRAPNLTFYFTSGGWIEAVAGNPPANDVVLLPDSFLIIRQPQTVSEDVTWAFTGALPTELHSIPLATIETDFQDNPISLARPVPISIKESGISSGFLPSLGTLSFQRRDQLLLYVNGVTGTNRAPSRTFYLYNGQWIEAIAGNPNADDVIINPTDALIVRKYQTSGGITSIMQNELKVYDSASQTWVTPSL